MSVRAKNCRGNTGEIWFDNARIGSFVEEPDGFRLYVVGYSQSWFLKTKDLKKVLNKAESLWSK